MNHTISERRIEKFTGKLNFKEGDSCRIIKINIRKTDR